VFAARQASARLNQGPRFRAERPTRLRVIAAASALGLVLGVAGQAIGAPAHPFAKQRSGGRQPGAHHARPARLSVLDKTADRFDRSLDVASRRVRRAEASPAADSTRAPAGGYPTPESVGVSSATLDAIASCESGGDPTAVSADGAYHGKYQFDYGTWAAVGGAGDPAAAPEAEQDYRAALLYVRGGSSPWPICG
jgi:soluble lytic murein transglycosylase-like protein